MNIFFFFTVIITALYICITFTFCLLIIYSGKENNKQQAVNMDKSK